MTTHRYPPAVVEAAARAAWNEERRQAAIDRRPSAGRMPSWDGLGPQRQTHCINQARAAIAAALNAWPGAFHHTFRGPLEGYGYVLPLTTQENGDAE